ncbi:ECF-type sigma factor [Pirellulales bacterium]|nr:ECF-type sigma factor [Pirellulales bacterium]
MELSQLLEQARKGDADARADVVRVAYEDLRRLARRLMNEQRPDHTLTSTALVHEVSARLLEKSHIPSDSRGEFMAYAATAMRRVLIDHARAKGSRKRGGRQQKLQLDEALTAAEQQPAELLELDEALQRLQEIDPRRSRVVEMRYFAGMRIDEVAQALEVSEATVKRDWTVAKLWLARELNGGMN